MPSSTATMLSQMTPQQLAMTPAAPPPPGVIPDFQQPATRISELLGVGILFLSVATALVGVRIYMKAIVLKKWKIEDTTLSLGYFVTLTYYILMCYGSVHASIGKHIYELHLSTMYGPLGFWIGIWSSSLPPQIGFGLIKASLFLQYYSLFKSTRWLRICLSIGLVFNVLSYFAVTIALIVLQSPWPGETILSTISSDHVAKCKSLFLLTGIIAVVIDWSLLLLPIPAVIRLKLSMTKKLGVLAIFMTGSLACIASAVSLYYRTTLGSIRRDPTWNMVTVINWILIEMSCGIIACCMPTIHLFWSRHTYLLKFGSKVRSSVRSILRITRSSYSSQEASEKHGEVNLRVSPLTGSDQMMSKDEIFVIQGHSVNDFDRGGNHSVDSQKSLGGWGPLKHNRGN